MQLGAIFPQTEIGADPVAVRDFVQAAEGLGYQHLLVFDHVVGANAALRTRPSRWPFSFAWSSTCPGGKPWRCTDPLGRRCDRTQGVRPG